LSKLRVGVIGLGEVAQVIHLPVLQDLADRYEVAAVCDISPGLLQRIGDRYSVESRYAVAADMVAGEDLDCVFVLNSDEYHAECVVAALRRGMHVFVEKPMCLSPQEGAAIIRARDDAGRAVMVGYMRRFAPAFVQAREQIEAMGRINYVRVHDIIGRNQLMIDQAATVDRPNDIPRDLMEGRWARGRKLVEEALGSVPDELAGTYRLLCGLGSHDLSAMRELLGPPRKVAAARQWRGGSFITALIEYDDFLVTYETGVDDQLRFDAHIEVYGESSSLRVQYDTPYIRHFPTVLVSEETRGDSYVRTVTRPHLKDPYTHELEYFHKVVTEGGSPKTSPEDFMEDLDLFAEIIRVLAASAED
jgi:predicted dehydrogenase